MDIEDDDKEGEDKQDEFQSEASDVNTPAPLDADTPMGTKTDNDGDDEQDGYSMDETDKPANEGLGENAHNPYSDLNDDNEDGNSYSDAGGNEGQNERGYYEQQSREGERRGEELDPQSADEDDDIVSESVMVGDDENEASQAEEDKDGDVSAIEEDNSEMEEESQIEVRPRPEVTVQHLVSGEDESQDYTSDDLRQDD
jgi:hypothetical protein